MKKNIAQQLAELPNKPGVYLFRDKKGKILYIGKAASIKKRVQSYFRDQPLLLPRIEKMVSQIAKIDFIETGSEVEALLLESNLIKKQKPKYNVEWKDDKNYLYMKVEGVKRSKGIKGNIGEGQFPRVYTVRRPDVPDAKYYGPFTDASAVRKTLAYLRRVFTYRTCKKFPKSPCLLYHIKRCPGPCIGEISPKEYQKIIKEFILFLEGKQKRLLTELKKRMKKLSETKEFEKAAKLRDKIKALEHIGQVSVLRKEAEEKSSLGLWELVTFLQYYFPELQIHPQFRIEAYDVSNISGTSGTGSMIVFLDGEKASDEYRRFAIKTVYKIDDVACMKEVLKRRFSHRDEWLLPDLIILDGGKGQLKAGHEAQKESHLSIPYLALAKKSQGGPLRGEEKIYLPQRPKSITLSKDSPGLLLIQRIRDEAHRFARAYHIKLRSKKMLKGGT